MTQFNPHPEPSPGRDDGDLPYFSVFVHWLEDTALVHVYGELDGAAGAKLDQSLTTGRGSHSKVAIDLSETTYIDQTGLEYLLDYLHSNPTAYVTATAPHLDGLLDLIDRQLPQG